MKKRLISLALALTLCLGLAVPAMAAGASGLDAAGAKAFNSTLLSYGSGKLVAFADVRDMNADGVPELIVVSTPKDDPYIPVATVDIWQLKNGSSVKGCSGEFEASQSCGMEYVTQNGKTYINVGVGFMRQGVFGSSSDYLGTDGFLESLSYQGDYNISEDTEYFRTANGVRTSISEAQFNQFTSAYSSAGGTFLEGGGLSWIWEGSYDGKHAPSYQTVLSLLAVKAAETPAPAAGTYGAFTITGSQYSDFFSVSFTSAKVEKATVQYRTQWYIDSNLVQTDPYKNLSVTLVTLKTGSNISVSASVDMMDTQYNLIQDGAGKYTYCPAALSVGEDFNKAFLSNSGDEMKRELQSGPIMIYANDSTYIVAYESPSGFSDVITGAYYAGAVNWAVDQGITAGTSATTFSPDQTCTVGQILTFLWRANGSPEPTIANPFTDSISASFQKAAVWAYQKGLVSGTTFGAGTPCTRAMAVTYLWKLAGSPAAGGVRASFADVPATADYAQAVAWAVSKGITSGTSATAFSPAATCTRGQIVTFLYRAMG